MVNIKRIFRHLIMTHWQVNRAFPSNALVAIDKAIKASEALHSCEIRFVLEGALDGAALIKGQTARERAIDVFSLLRIWDTELNNGVLIYLLFADRDIEIIADRGFHAKVGEREWENICRKMEAAFKQQHYADGVVTGIQEVSYHLRKHFPDSGTGRNELPDHPVLL